MSFMIKRTSRISRFRMNRYIRASALTVFAAGFSFLGSMPAAAAQIREIKIRLEAESFEEDGWPLVEAYCASSQYTVTGIWQSGEAGNSGNGPSVFPDPADGIPYPGKESEEEETGKEGITEEERNESKQGTEEEGTRYIKIELTAEDEDVFGRIDQDEIRFSGVSAVCTKAVRGDAGQSLLLTVELEAPGELVGEIGRAALEGTCARWEAAPNASSYLAMLYRNQRRVGYPHRTAGLTYDFAPLMQESGIYYCKVYPLTESGKKGSPAESGLRQVRKEEADQIRDGLCASIFQKEADAVPGEELPEEEASGWRFKENQKFYLEKDGCMPQENWLFLDGCWYYFDGMGAAKTSCWQEWKGRWYYLDPEGRLEKESGENPFQASAC